MLRSPDGGELCGVGNVETRGDLGWVEDVVTVVPDVGLVLGGEEVAELDSRADVAGFAVGGADVVPVRGRCLGVEIVEVGVLSELGAGYDGELVTKESFGSGYGVDVLGSENGSFVGVVTVNG